MAVATKVRILTLIVPQDLGKDLKREFLRHESLHITALDDHYAKRVTLYIDSSSQPFDSAIANLEQVVLALCSEIQQALVTSPGCIIAASETAHVVGAFEKGKFEELLKTKLAKIQRQIPTADTSSQDAEAAKNEPQSGEAHGASDVAPPIQLSDQAPNSPLAQRIDTAPKDRREPVKDQPDVAVPEPQPVPAPGVTAVVPPPRTVLSTLDAAKPLRYIIDCSEKLDGYTSFKVRSASQGEILTSYRVYMPEGRACKIQGLLDRRRIVCEGHVNGFIAFLFDSWNYMKYIRDIGFLLRLKAGPTGVYVKGKVETISPTAIGDFRHFSNTLVHNLPSLESYTVQVRGYFDDDIPFPVPWRKGAAVVMATKDVGQHHSPSDGDDKYPNFFRHIARLPLKHENGAKIDVKVVLLDATTAERRAHEVELNEQITSWRTSRPDQSRPVGSNPTPEAKHIDECALKDGSFHPLR